MILNNGTKLGVSSAVLRTASDMFRAMFGPNFREGQNLNETNPKEVEFPDDDPAAMMVICSVFHFQYDHTQHYPDMAELKDIALLCDKYQCSPAIFLHSQMWMERLMKDAMKKKFDGYEDLLGISYLFDNPDVFKRLTLDLILYWTGSFDKLGDRDLADRIPWRTFGKFFFLQSRKNMANVMKSDTVG
ncbi:uncharacterized protein K452DRAFT_346706 [Aplosporella prunicola CBS 121167]|uniref:BTB domain-containing protein n=1 Tax=Aplosporella prunicola CBS 121167 TaxID=1176127 RepID=A0A6A6AVU9_9PEZI|nr:uncharacterized protein K452DRAFT_346706 [Aplosporella prunicola CBS 121167]KAF2135726.1 hypothetical protein K452DRAFT_346706 [Aplosporella prunicola CBS 121167]